MIIWEMSAIVISQPTERGFFFDHTILTITSVLQFLMKLVIVERSVFFFAIRNTKFDKIEKKTASELVWKWGSLLFHMKLYTKVIDRHFQSELASFFPTEIFPWSKNYFFTRSTALSLFFLLIFRFFIYICHPYNYHIQCFK